MLSYGIKISYTLSAFVIEFRCLQLLSESTDLKKSTQKNHVMRILDYPGRKADSGMKAALIPQYLQYWQYGKGVKRKNKLTMTQKAWAGIEVTGWR